MPRRSVRGELLRQALAREAARLIIEHGVGDYGLAKRKAAERLGATDRAVLPKNTEIEEAVAAHQRLFAPDAHASELAAMRRAALGAMRLLADFEPRLVGPLVSGTATAHQDITLHLFADTPESVAVRLLDRGIRHQFAERRVRVQRDGFQAYPAVRFPAGAHEVEAMIFPLDGIRQAPLAPLDGRPMRRATMQEVEELVAGEAGSVA